MHEVGDKKKQFKTQQQCVCQWVKKEGHEGGFSTRDLYKQADYINIDTT